MHDDSLNKLLTHEIEVLTDDVKKLYAKIAGIEQGCCVRHRINLTSEISHLETGLANLKTLVDSNVTSITTHTSEISEITLKLQKIAGQVNILSVKINDMEQAAQKYKETKSNFIIQVAIIVLASIITAVFGWIGTYTWLGIQQKEEQPEQSGAHYRRYDFGKERPQRHIQVESKNNTP
jgi:hypothetical protein